MTYLTKTLEPSNAPGQPLHPNCLSPSKYAFQNIHMLYRVPNMSNDHNFWLLSQAYSNQAPAAIV